MAHSYIYTPFDKFVLRTPLFSVSLMERLFSGTQLSDETLTEVLRDEVIQEAIFVASPQLYNEILRWLKGEIVKAKKVRKFKTSVLKYLVRMSTRCTPFGLFAGFSVGEWGTDSRIVPSPTEACNRHTRLDMNYLVSLSQDLAETPEIKAQLRFYPNSTYYRTGGQVRYVEYRKVEEFRTYHIVSVDDSDYLVRLMALAQEGAYIHELANEIVEEDIPFADARYFVEQLIESQLLVPESEPTLAGPEFQKQLMKTLRSLKKDSKGIIQKSLMVLGNVEKVIEEIDNTAIGKGLGRYELIESELKKISTPFTTKHLLQTDMVKPCTHAVLSKRVAFSALRGIEAMARLYPKPPLNLMEEFKRTFTQRYEEKEVPLTEVLDTEIGIGYPIGAGKGEFNPLIDDLILPTAGGTTTFYWNQVHTFLFKKYTKEVAQKGKLEIEITDKELDQFPLHRHEFPDTFSSVVKLVKNKDADTPMELIQMHYMEGGTATDLIGRFCHADEKTHELAKEIIKKEEEINEDGVLADIIHLPQSRVGNILLHPTFFTYEIPYLARSGVEAEHQIDINDLTLSMKYNQLVLRSKKLNKTIHPRLSNAHQYDSPPRLAFIQIPMRLPA